MKALYIGRFQPFHKGHLKVIKNILSKHHFIFIGIGSSQYSNTYKNPFTYSERKKMIEDSLKRENINNFKIFSIPDIHNPPKWVKHVLSIIKDFNILVTNNSFTEDLFKKKGFKVINTPIYNSKDLSGKNIRSKIKNNKKWENLVPDEVEKVIKEIDGLKRIKECEI